MLQHSSFKNKLVDISQNTQTNMKTVTIFFLLLMSSPTTLTKSQQNRENDDTVQTLHMEEARTRGSPHGSRPTHHVVIEELVLHQREDLARLFQKVQELTDSRQVMKEELTQHAEETEGMIMIIFLVEGIFFPWRQHGF